MKRPPQSTAGRSTRKSIKSQVREFLEQRRPEAVTEAVWTELLTRLAPVSESYLRELLRASGLPFDMPWAGIRQHTFEELADSLCAMQQIYAEAMEAGDRERARYCRRLVIGAKDRAKFLSGNPRTGPELAHQKREMAEWMLVWLENPEVFSAWLEARRRVKSAHSGE
jgi:hypothetical protein